MRNLVLTAEAMGSNPDQIRGHSEGIQGQPDLGTGLVGPVHRNFCYAIASLPSHHQHLDIEAESVHPHSREQVLCHPGPKELETALRILDSAIGKRFHQEVEGTANQMPIELCVNPDAHGPKSPRPHGKISTQIKRAFQPLDLRNRGRPISVGEEHQAPDRIYDSGSDGIPFSMVRGQPDQSELMEFLGQPPTDGAGGITASVVYQDYLERPTDTPAIRDHIADRWLDSRLFVIGRYDDGEIWSSDHGDNLHRGGTKRQFRGLRLAPGRGRALRMRYSLPGVEEDPFRTIQRHGR